MRAGAARPSARQPSPWRRRGPPVVVRSRLRMVRRHRNRPLRTAQSLYLRLLVNGQHDGGVWRVDIQARDVAGPELEPRVARDERDDGPTMLPDGSAFAIQDVIGPTRHAGPGPASEMNREGRANARGEVIHRKSAQFRPQPPFPPFPILPSCEVFTWCSLGPFPFRMPCMVATAIPILFASARTVQCRACAGAFTLSSAIGFFPGGRVASRRRPSTPSARKRSHHSATPSASTCPSAESSPPARAPSRAQGRCAPAGRASGDSAGGPRPVRGARAARPKARFPVLSISRPSTSLPFCWPLETAAGEQCHASERNGISCFK